MKMNLDPVEIRILGCLMEKELTTPESYPLSLNSLANGCNQKSNREPLMNLDEASVLRALDLLSFRGLARLTATGGRVPRYRHSIAEILGLDPPARAVLSELMLRGPQTMGELRVRTERMVSYPDITVFEATLVTLQHVAPPLIICLPLQSGRKEQRYAHLLAGMPEMPTEVSIPSPEKARKQVTFEDERFAKLQSEISSLHTEITEVHELINNFKATFE